MEHAVAPTRTFDNSGSVYLGVSQYSKAAEGPAPCVVADLRVTSTTAPESAEVCMHPLAHGAHNRTFVGLLITRHLQQTLCTVHAMITSHGCPNRPLSGTDPLGTPTMRLRTAQVACRFTATQKLFGPSLIHSLLATGSDLLPSHLLGTLAVVTGSAGMVPKLQGLVCDLERQSCAGEECVPCLFREIGATWPTSGSRGRPGDQGGRASRHFPVAFSHVT